MGYFGQRPAYSPTPQPVERFSTVLPGNRHENDLIQPLHLSQPDHLISRGRCFPMELIANKKTTPDLNQKWPFC